MLIFLCFGSYLGESIAAEIDLSSQGNETQSENVKFNVYLDEVDSTVKEKIADISSSEINLYISVNVQDEGYLNNPVIELVDTNFKLKNKPEVTSFKLADSIQPGKKGTTKGIQVIVKNDESYDLSLLDMQSKIRLTGEYVDGQGYVTPIDTIKEVKITWTSNELTQEDIELSQEVITNKIYNIDGENKRVVQVLVKSKVQDNKVPVESSFIEITNPITDKVTNTAAIPEDVKVASYGTEATNGESFIEFVKNVGDTNNIKSSWEYSETDGKTSIQILNNAEENIVAWTKNAEDIFVVTYVYDENVEISTFVSDVKNTVEIYGNTTQSVIEKTNQLSLKTEEDIQAIKEIGNIANLETSLTENIYKGKMYIGENTIYEEKSTLYVPFSEIADTITINYSDSRVSNIETTEEDTTSNVIEAIDTYYKTTKINKAQAQKVLGENGTITVYNEGVTTPIQTISLSEATEEDYYTITYEDLTEKTITIRMSTAQTDGKIEIINEKVINVTDTTVVKDAANLESTINLTVVDENQNTVVATKNPNTANLVEPKTTFNASVDKTTLSALAENDIRITTELITKDEINKLFKSSVLDSKVNPVIINIEMPEEIIEASIENITPVVGSDELDIKSHNVITNEAGNKVISIEIEGEQTTYTEDSASIVIDAKAKINQFMADKNVEMKTTVINDGETVEKTNQMKILSKSGLVTKSTIKIGADVEEKINVNSVSVDAKAGEEVEVVTEFINNYGDTLSNGVIIGNIPSGATLKTAVTTNTENDIVYYSEETNPSLNSENWKTELTDLSTVKSFKIEKTEIAQGELVLVSYKYTLNEDVTEPQISTIKVTGTVAEEAKEETITYTTNVETTTDSGDIPEDDKSIEENKNDVDIVIKAKTKTDIIHEGQIITYNIKVTNTGIEALNDVILSYSIPEGTVYTELTYAQAAEIEYTDNEELKIKDWSIETIAPNQSIEKEITIRINEGTSQIINKAELKDSEGSIISQISTEPMQVKESKISVMLSTIDNMIIELNEGATIQYYVKVKNISNAAINNLVVSSSIPENTVYLENSEYNKEWSYNKQDNIIYNTIDTLEANETKGLIFEVKVDKLNYNIASAKIENSVIVKDNNSDTYESNIFTSKVNVARWTINQTSEHPSTLKEGDQVKYVIEVKNIGTIGERVEVKDSIPNEIQISKVKTYINKDLIQEKDYPGSNDIDLGEYIKVGEIYKIEIQGFTCNLEDNIKSKEIRNIAKIDLGDGEYLGSQEIVNTIVNDIVTPSTNPETDNKEQTNSISGLAWVDENKDGIQTDEEGILQGIEVILIDKEGKQVAQTTTSLTGTYKFTSLEQGEYTVIFKYDTSKYAVTTYQVSGATVDTNSDVIAKEIELNGEKILVGITDTIKLQEQDITNINIGLIENAKFDLSLDKYITKVVLINSAGTTTYEYDNTTLAKVEISAKRIAGTVVLIEYNLEITNEGDVDAYVGDVVDYFPDDLVFTSDTNEDWYMDGNGVLHNNTLKEQAIKPGQTKSVKLILTKTLKADSTGTIENIGEIGETSNLEGIEEYDSIAENKEIGEDDMSNASLIISISTGSPVMYIGIVMGSMLVLGLGIYLINKKVLKGGI